jgi:hypothetical protein
MKSTNTRYLTTVKIYGVRRFIFLNNANINTIKTLKSVVPIEQVLKKLFLYNFPDFSNSSVLELYKV